LKTERQIDTVRYLNIIIPPGFQVPVGINFWNPAMVRLTREESRERTREHLIEAARRLVIEKGYDGTSVTDIAEAAGYSKGAIFSNFDSKEAIFLEVLRRHKAAMFERFAEVVAATRRERTMAALDAYLNGLNRQTDLAHLDIALRLHAGRSPAFAAAFAAFDDETETTIGTLASQMFQAAGRRPPDEPRALGKMFLALVHGLALHGAPDTARAMRMVIEALVAAAPPE
jgi:AcrR family transcriptional regulator